MRNAQTVSVSAVNLLRQKRKKHTLAETLLSEFYWYQIFALYSAVVEVQ